MKHGITFALALTLTAQQNDQTRISVDVTRGNMLFTQARIDGQPITLLVDTGAERTLLTEATVERLHLPRDLQHATRTFGIGSPTATWDAKLANGIVLGATHFPVDSVTVGRFTIHEVAGGSADGLLGADIMLAFDIDLDLPARRITSTALLNSVPRLDQGLLFTRRFAAMAATLKPGWSICGKASICIMAVRIFGSLNRQQLPRQFGVKLGQRE